MGKIAKNRIFWEILLLWGAWALISFSLTNGYDDPERFFRRITPTLIGFIIIVQINVRYLLPKFYLQKKRILFIGGGTLLLAATVLLMYHEIFPWSEWFRLPPPSQVGEVDNRVTPSLFPGTKKERTISTLPTQSSEEKQKDYILVKSDFKVFRIFHKDILYVESMKEYVAYHTLEGRTLSLGSLKKLEQELPSELFMRIHKSYIANISRIAALEGNMVHLGKKKLPIGTSYKEAVMKRVF